MKAITLLGLFAISTALQAGMYRWVDENGVTQYTQTPPPNQDADRLRPPPPPAEDPKTARERLDRQLQAVDDRREDRDLADAERRKQAEKRKIAEQNCQNARTNLERLDRAGNRLILMPDGNYQRMAEEDRQRRIEEARKVVNENCR